MFANRIVSWRFLRKTGTIVCLSASERNIEIPGFRRAVIRILAPAQMSEILRAFVHAIVGFAAAIVAIRFFFDTVRFVRCFFCLGAKLLKLISLLVDSREGFIGLGGGVLFKGFSLPRNEDGNTAIGNAVARIGILCDHVCRFSSCYEREHEFELFKRRSGFL